MALIGGRGSAAFREGLALQLLVGHSSKRMLFPNATLSHGVRKSRPVRDWPPGPMLEGEGLAGPVVRNAPELFLKVRRVRLVSDESQVFALYAQSDV
jgi:hypothetical protein